MEPPVKKQCHPCQCTSQEAGSVGEELEDSAQHEETDISATFTEILSIMDRKNRKKSWVQSHFK